MIERPTGIIRNLRTGHQHVVSEKLLLKIMQDKYKKKEYEIIECSEDIKHILDVKELKENPHARILGQTITETTKKVNKKEKVK